MHTKIPTRNDAWVRWARLIGALFVAATLLALMSGCEDRTINREVWPKAEYDPMKEALKSCRLVSTEDTMVRRYCGKSCWHAVIRHTYSCEDGTTKVVEK